MRFTFFVPALLALASSGCLSSRLVKVEANPGEHGLILMKIENTLAFPPFSSDVTEEVFMTCADGGNTLVCSRACDGWTDPADPSSDLLCRSTKR